VRCVTTADGVVLRIAVHGARGATGTAAAAVVLAHGFTATSRDPAVVSVADALTAGGYDVVTYDARGHGASGGRCTLGDSERHDVAAAVEVARGRHDRVVLVGASMGGIAVLGHAAGDGSLAGVVTVSSPARWRFPRTARALAAALATQTALGRRVVANRCGVRLAGRWTRPDEPVVLAARLQAPLVVVHGEADQFLPVIEATELLQSAAAPSRLVLVPAMGHAFDAASLPAIVDAVGWVLESSASAAAAGAGPPQLRQAT
jgi:pimeloyl-ACP methyl ester carboxylesterase